MKVPFYRHDLAASDAAAIAAVLRTPHLTTGAVGRAVEAQLADYFSTRHAVLTSSWTTGAHATLMALGIGPGDEVLVPAMTFIASANVVELVGATPVFIDIDPETLLMTPAALAAALTPATRAVMPVHLYGQMCDMAGLRKVLATRPDIALIEDCAHCFEGRRADKRPGVYSDAAIFSFYATKNVTCGEGGAVVTNRADLAASLRSIRSHGMSAAAAERFQNGFYRHWDMERLGLKANLPDLLAALLPPQIKTVDARLARREELARYYEAALSDLPLRLVESVPDVLHARHLLPIHVPPQIRDKLIHGLNSAGIGVTVNYTAVPATTYYREKYGFACDSFPHARAWGAGTLSLPLYPALTRAQQDHVVDTLATLLEALTRSHRVHVSGVSEAPPQNFD
ncbi:MAG: DegT/DnrJ/EryC1/StrS family aminotransferase [Pseudomonadota bacterium]